MFYHYAKNLLQHTFKLVHRQWSAEMLKCLQTRTYCRWISRLTDSWKTSSTSCLITLAGGGRMEALYWDSQASRMELRFNLRWARSSHMLRSRLFRWSLNWTGWVKGNGQITIITEVWDCYGGEFKWAHYSFVSGVLTWFWGRWKSTDQ